MALYNFFKNLRTLLSKVFLITRSTFRLMTIKMMGDTAEATRQQVLQSLQGQTIETPDLVSLLKTWPQYVNPELERLRSDVDQQFRSFFPEGRRLRKMQATDAALFGACWWPYASFERLRVATFFSIWLFVWDDETDSPEFSSLVSDFDAAEAFRAETVAFIRSCLTGSSQPFGAKRPTSDIITSFEPIGQAIVESCTRSQISRFLDELLFFVNMTSVEQRFLMTGNVPTVEEYQGRRMGSSAVGTCLAIAEYCFDMEIAPDIMNGEEMKAVWKETNIIISTVNDILSIRKEIQQGQVDSLIPLLYLRHGSLDAAMSAAVDIVKTSISAFEVASRKLLDQHPDDDDLHTKLKQFIHGCQCACTANLNWSLTSGRYKLGGQSLDDGAMVKL